MMSTEIDLPSIRLRENGWESLSEAELLAIALAPGLSERRALELARAILSFSEWQKRGTRMSYRRLRKIGLSHKRARAFLAMLEFSQRTRRPHLETDTSFRSSLDIFRFFLPRVIDLRKECFWNVLLDGKNRIIRIVKVSEGSLTSSLVHPREVFRPAIEEAAAAVLFVHNHPSGDPTPSREDQRITSRLVETGRVIGIRVLDHVVIGHDRYFSFADQGLILSGEP
ncbi:MAG TPA: DNA repair protein RadC [Acidobacteriota bacterium]|nr:DNA repair protein RadC [Acidobacteriota bacterium]